MRGRAWLSLTAVLILFSGCSSLERTGTEPSGQDLVAYYRYAANLNPEPLAHEYANFQDWVQGESCSEDRVRLAILAMQAEEPPGSGAEPEAILEPCLGETESSPPALRDMAFLLHDQLHSRTNLRTRYESLTERVNRLEAELSQAKERSQALVRQKGELEKRVESLRSQLEALKNIERSLRQRN
jgi:hypothetical protein